MARQRGSGFLDGVIASVANAEPSERKPRGGSFLARELSQSNAGLESRLAELEAKYGGALPVRKIPADQIHRGPFANRLPSAFDATKDARFAYLKEQIEATGGNVAPVFVRVVKGRDTYELVYGERRWRACEQLGLEVLAIIASIDDTEAALLQHHENNAREDISVIESAMQINSWMTRLEGEQSQDFARRIKITPSHLSNLRLIGRLPEELLHVHPDPRMLTFKIAYALAKLHRDTPKVLQERLAALEAAPAPVSTRYAEHLLLHGKPPRVGPAPNEQPKATIRRGTLSIPLQTLSTEKRTEFLDAIAELAKTYGYDVGNVAG